MMGKLSVVMTMLVLVADNCACRTANDGAFRRAKTGGTAHDRAAGAANQSATRCAA